MKRPVLWISLFCLLLAAGLNRIAVDPGHFTGIWYAEGGEVFCFREGIIRRLQPESEGILEGAYSFTSGSITLFVTGHEELGSVTTLYRIPGKDGDVLCTTSDGRGTVCFSRNPDTE